MEAPYACCCVDAPAAKQTVKGNLFAVLAGLQHFWGFLQLWSSVEVLSSKLTLLTGADARKVSNPMSLLLHIHCPPASGFLNLRHTVNVFYRDHCHARVRL